MHDLKAVVDRHSETRLSRRRWTELRVADAITEVFSIVFRRCNKYIDETAPWVLAKDEAQKDRLDDSAL